uniref:Uncharacterized protein n=1 Tax=Cacopsylla melanoneura TaxID=428564 RepID=A0A8D8YME2_9HEMI
MVKIQMKKAYFFRYLSVKRISYIRFCFNFNCFPFPISSFNCFSFPISSFNCFSFPNSSFNCFSLPISSFNCFPFPISSFNYFPFPIFFLHEVNCFPHLLLY